MKFFGRKTAACIIVVGLAHAGLVAADSATGNPATGNPATGNPAAAMKPLVRVVDMSIGETRPVELSNGEVTRVSLVSLKEHRDSVSGAVRRAEVNVRIDGVEAQLVAATYHLPIRVGKVQIDCSITSGYNRNGRPSSWGLDKDARLRLWPADSPWVRPGTFGYPAKQRWFASLTQMANVPTYVDGGEDPERRENIYYHSGLDIGGSEGLVQVVAATEGLVVSAGLEVLAEHRVDTPVAPRYDVVYLLDRRGWYYRYSHLKEIDETVRPGRIVQVGDPIGSLGKEGGSGGWSHLHFEIKSRQPSGKWGTQAGYAFLWEAYQRQYQPRIVAVARPHHFLFSGQEALLDASKSQSSTAGDLEYQWTFHDGTSAVGAQVRRRYERAGSYSEVVRVADADGNVAYDFAVVQVVDRHRPGHLPPTVHPTYYPTIGIKPHDPVIFKVRSFRTKKASEQWDFDDGSPTLTVHSDGNSDMHNPAGYATTTHRFARPGDYVVRVESRNEHGLLAVSHLHVRVEPPGEETASPRDLQTPPAKPPRGG